MTRIPSGQLPRFSMPVISATQAPSRTWPSLSQAGAQAVAGMRDGDACLTKVRTKVLRVKASDQPSENV